MSKFSEKIESLIDESGENVQSLARIGDINRTTLQRVKTGERLPTKEFLGKLAETLRLSVAEQTELYELYEIQK
ncbi:MAG: helix-turn-helix domain-containing protein, partial [Firmicutes bacterium]|nr:helix-turn-helix domain-containing protein [Bacillota bacterium]